MNRIAEDTTGTTVPVAWSVPFCYPNVEYSERVSKAFGLIPCGTAERLLFSPVSTILFDSHQRVDRMEL